VDVLLDVSGKMFLLLLINSNYVISHSSLNLAHSISPSSSSSFCNVYYACTLWTINVLKLQLKKKPSLTTHVKKLTTGNNVIIVSVIV